MDNKELQNLLDSLDEGPLGKRKEWVWDRITLKTKFTKEKLKEIAKQYDALGDFEKNNSGAYQHAIKYNYLEEITSHMGRKTFWTVDKAFEVAKLYKTRTEMFKSKHKTAYVFLLKNNLLDECFSKKHVNEVSKEEHYKLAKTCKTRSEYYNKKSSYYQKALKEGWLDEWFPKKRGTK